MGHVVVIGGGIGGLPTAFELRRLLPSAHRITLISDKPRFTFVPSLPWVALGLTPPERIQADLNEVLKGRGIAWVPGAVREMKPLAREIKVGARKIEYDYAVIATGASLALGAVPGLEPEKGCTQSVCNLEHALKAREAWEEFKQHPGNLVVGAVPGTSCVVPAYEFALLADHVLRQRNLRHQVRITLVTPEPFAGHMGLGGIANSDVLMMNLMKRRHIELIENAAVAEIHPQTVMLADGRRLPFKYSMLLPPFRGAQFLREVPGLTDKTGFMPVLPTYQHPEYQSIYSIGLAVGLEPTEKTPVPMSVPKTAQMTEGMGMAVAHNIACRLGAVDAALVTPTLSSICLADFGGTGLFFIADPVLPDGLTGHRRRMVAKGGPWVSRMKTVFERFFMIKIRLGLTVPWFERWGLRAMGLSLVEPLASHRDSALSWHFEESRRCRIKPRRRVHPVVQQVQEGGHLRRL